MPTITITIDGGSAGQLEITQSTDLNFRDPFIQQAEIGKLLNRVSATVRSAYGIEEER
jgi:hypothetical protein